MSLLSKIFFKDNNQTGNVGEWVASTRLSQNGIFSVLLAGGKTPLFDLLVEVNDSKRPYQFLVQVKSTVDSDMYRKAGMIHTPVPSKKYEKLVKKPMPTYVAGLDLDQEVMYIHSAYDASRKISYVPKTYMLSKENRDQSKKNLELLRDDVIEYWNGLKIDTYKPKFISKL